MYRFLPALALALHAAVAIAQTPPAVVVPPPPPAPPVPAVVAPPPPPNPTGVTVAPAPPPPRVRRDPIALPVGELQTLEKITGRVRGVDAVVGTPTQVGTLVITLRACRKRPQEETPETAAFFEINEQRPGETTATRLFTGWMFASSPAVAALEHPVYDVWLVDCKASAGSISR